jgi:hypothetical protein
MKPLIATPHPVLFAEIRLLIQFIRDNPGVENKEMEERFERLRPAIISLFRYLDARRQTFEYSFAGQYILTSLYKFEGLPTVHLYSLELAMVEIENMNREASAIEALNQTRVGYKKESVALAKVFQRLKTILNNR